MIVHDILALDRASVRTRDANGFLHVAVSNISKANVCPYYGSEIPDCENLGLDPKRSYNLLRDPKELEAAAGTFNGVPLLNRHIPVIPEKLPEDAIVGTIGNDATFMAPYLKNSLTVWSAVSIKGIETEEQCELSCGYYYEADMTPGVFEGVSYDGVMRNIRGNHVSLVPEGRAGPDVLVGDSALPINKETKFMVVKTPLTRRAALLASGAIRAYLAPKLAQDAKIDLATALKGVTAAKWKTGKPALVKALGVATKGKLAQDADIADVIELLDQLDDAVGEVVDTDDIPVASEVDDDPAMDDDVMAKVKAILGPDADDEKCKALCALLTPAQAQDDPPETPGTPEAPSKKKPDALTQGAMDAAISAAIKATETRTIARLNAIQEAHEIVAGSAAGKVVGAFDSAEGVFKAGLDVLEVDVAGVHPSAYRAILSAHHKLGDTPKPQNRQAQDASGLEDFKKLFPDAPRVRHL